jgi:tRNA threonylcarbamoyladenosine biosynthesis protein TsaE
MPGADALPAEYRSASEDDTLAYGRRFAARLSAGSVVALHGELGSGKTAVARGICEALGCGDQVCSPSFTIINEYDGTLTVAHCDLYRLEREDEVPETGFEELFDGRRVVLIEWAERAASLLPLPRHEVRCEYGEDQNERMLRYRLVERDGSGER